MKIAITSLLIAWFFVVVGDATAASPQYPVKPIRIIVALGAGGTAEAAARAIAEPLSRSLGQPVIIDNRPGADGAIGAKLARNAAADGYTLLWGQATNMVGIPLVSKSPPYDPVKDFTPLSFVGRFTILIVVHPNVPAKTLPELVEHARANPGKVSYSANSITETIAASQIFKNTEIVRIAYKGGTAAIPDLLTGRLQFGLISAFVGLPHVKEGRLRPLATLLPKRSRTLPDIPTVAEVGFSKASMTPWFALFGPAGLPADIVERLSREINSVLDQPLVRSELERLTVEVEGSTPRALALFLNQELESWGRVIRDAGIPLQ